MERTVPAKETASAQKRAGRFMSVLFSFRQRLHGRARYSYDWHWARATETGGEKIVLLLRALSLSNQIARGAASIHQTAHLHACSVTSRRKGLNYYWPAWIFGVINPT